jgi:uncharacterized protein YecE (DUF72 family)
MPSIRIGTCGWSYKDWAGVFYPEHLAPGEYLAAYADRFPVVEADTTFYRTPSLKMVREWRDKTPAGFGFSLKVPQFVTHEKVLQDCQEELEGFLAMARILGDKLLCCLLQFGYFNRSAFSSLDRFLERLDPFLAAWPKDVPVAVEIRNKNWATAKFTECLRRHQTVWALTDQAWMPSPLHLIQTLDAVTAPFAYFRLMGHRDEIEALTKTFDRIVIDRGEQVRADAEAMRLLSQRVPVLAFVNNHFAGHGPETVRQLQQALASGSAAPP